MLLSLRLRLRGRLPGAFALLAFGLVLGLAGPAAAQSASPAGADAPSSQAAPSAPAAPAIQPQAVTPPTVTAPAAPPPADDTAASPAGAVGNAPFVLPENLSPYAMFLHADIVVKCVMVGLALASVLTWTVWIAKSLHLFGARRSTARGVRALLKADNLSSIPKGVETGPVAALVHAARQERDRSGNLPAEGVKERAAIALARVEARAARVMTKGTGLVATVGSTAPFVGLFGTVWGIMNSFVGISRAHTTNLAVVAPGIAEALLATAIGLIAAIPAVVIYNSFARGISGYKALLADAGAEVMRHLSRDLDRRSHGAA